MLMAAGRPVRISSRALDILTALVDCAGELVSKDQLIARAWPDTKVEENNLRVHIGALRKLLGESTAGVSTIATVPGRGYSFVAPVERESVRPLLAAVPAPMTVHPLPAPLTRMIGRAETLVMFLSRMRKRRLVTIVGPGGMGKTTIALAMAERLNRSLEHHASFVDLSPLADPQLLPSALASVFGIPSRAENPLVGVLAFLRDKRMLIVLDSCEHLVEAAAALVEALLKGAAGVQILATSREPLGVEGEWVERLAPLGHPDLPAGLSAAQALAYPAIQLFAERAAAGVENFELSEKDVQAAVEICQKLDGIPLAIELAAARVGLFGIPGVAARLNDRLAVLTRGRRTASPRHKTLRATLDWSYGILSADEQVVLQRLAIFCGEFTLDAATAVAASTDIATADLPELVATLVAKSLVVATLKDGIAWYRLLDTTREYARAKLLESTDYHNVAKLHAETLCKSLLAIRASPGTAVAAELTSTYKRMVDDVRAALRWSFSSHGDHESGVRLTAAAGSLFLRLSLLDECRSHVERVMKDSTLMAKADSLAEMNLHLVLGHIQLHKATLGSQFRSTFDRALQIAERLALAAPRADALVGAWIASTRSCDYPKALEFAQRFRHSAAATGEMDELVYSRMMALPLLYLGEFSTARHYLEHALAHPLRRAQAAHDHLFYVDLEVVTYANLARIFWFQGFADQAGDAANRSLDRAVSINQATGICYSLVIAACPVAIWRGDLPEAHRLTSMLSECSSLHSFDSLRSWARLLERILHSGNAPHEPWEIDTLDSTALHLLDQIATLREGSVPPEALARVESGRVGWNAAEILRVMGEQVLKDGGPEAARTAEAAYLRSLDIARRQAALSWELRTATSLARLWREQHRTREARELLADVHGRFTEGFQTADYARAGALLVDLSDPNLGRDFRVSIAGAQ
jgi:predicted ATPase/DNA-binding winged helix-turn-helix (wHTH) protein